MSKQQPYLSTKTFRNLPTTHRAWKHDGHCSFIHGYSREYKFTFACTELDERGWVVDFGSLKELKKWLIDHGDHVTLINQDDPELEFITKAHLKGIIDLKVVPNCSCEGMARLALTIADDLIKKQTKGRAWVQSVECRENDKNSAIAYNEIHD